MVKPIVKDKGIDHTIDFLREGYSYFSKQMNEYHADVMQFRMFGRKLVMVRGEEAADFVKDRAMFQREKSIPELSSSSLTEENGVFYLADMDTYHENKWLQYALNTEKLKEFEWIIRQRWEERIEAWKIEPSIHFVTEMEEMWVIAICNWLGIPIRANNLKQRTKDIQQYVQLFSRYGFNQWNRNQARNHLEKWLVFIVRQLRAGRIHIDEDKILYKLAWYEDKSNQILPTKTVVHALLLLIRTFAASSRWVIYSQLALIENPELKARLQVDEKYVQCFIYEVIRFYSIVPFSAAKTQQHLFWKEMFFPKNETVLFDIYGTNHHPCRWTQPELFQPDRFLEKAADSEAGVGKELGSVKESVTVQLMRVNLSYLLRTDWIVPDQIPDSRSAEIPARLKNGLRLKFYQERENY
ncbi:cytochrome P450 [Oceanobacillus sp. J11TS1]|uniref:cytochrome P450 n=1 Tax=Oceanobacillus sp. J11TS1 TaxID=2807191 RepID=UPI001B0906FE|nr:cytochrome P450 [Oceanobacillus sp. J11TS1]GIO24966.1 cytochrome P450 [Oceanobacillus sp. J11TS1]